MEEGGEEEEEEEEEREGAATQVPVSHTCSTDSKCPATLISPQEALHTGSSFETRHQELVLRLRAIEERQDRTDAFIARMWEGRCPSEDDAVRSRTQRTSNANSDGPTSALGHGSGVEGGQRGKDSSGNYVRVRVTRQIDGSLLITPVEFRDACDNTLKNRSVSKLAAATLLLLLPRTNKRRSCEALPQVVLYRSHFSTTGAVIPPRITTCA